jgi:Spy/CpxP family protein refolding chaperone
VTVTAGATGPSARRHKWLWVALALSLTLNLFVAGGLVWSSMRPPMRPPPGPAERLLGAAHQLNLSPDQRTALERFGVASRELNQQLRAANAPLMRQIWEEVAKAQPDSAVVSRLTDQALENRRTFQQKMATNLMTFIGTLTPDQRKEFTDAVTRRPGPGLGR